MSKSTNSTVWLRAILLTAVVVASVIGAVAFFSGPVAAGENHSPNQQEVTQNEEAEGSTVDNASAITEPDYLGGSSSGPAFDWCYVTVASGDEIPQIHPKNTVKVNAELCEQIGLLIVGYYWQETMK